MYVTAFSTPRYPQWRWRITDGDGAVIEESQRSFDTISAAVAVGTERMVSMNNATHQRWRP
jgi:hypothetical protein